MRNEELKVTPYEDFSHLVEYQGVRILYRELTGKDLYLLALWEDIKGEEYLRDPEVQTILMSMLSCEPYKITEDELLDLPVEVFYKYLQWFIENRLVDRVMGLNEWLTLCFHLMKQRWQSDLEWLERLPIVKVLQMSDIQSSFHESVNKEINSKVKSR